MDSEETNTVVSEPEDVQESLECRVDFSVNPYMIDAPVPGYCVDCGD